MRICDRCGAAAVEYLRFEMAAEVFDLCHTCREAVRDMVVTVADEADDKKRKTRAKKPEKE